MQILVVFQSKLYINMKNLQAFKRTTYYPLAQA